MSVRAESSENLGLQATTHSSKLPYSVIIVSLNLSYAHLQSHSSLQEPSTNIRFPDVGTERKNVDKKRCSVVIPLSYNAN